MIRFARRIDCCPLTIGIKLAVDGCVLIWITFMREVVNGLPDPGRVPAHASPGVRRRSRRVVSITLRPVGNGSDVYDPPNGAQRPYWSPDSC